MNRYAMLCDKRGALLDESDKLFARLETEGRVEMTDEEKARDDAIHAEVAKLDAEIDRERRRMDAAVRTPGTVPTGERLSIIGDRQADKPWGFDYRHDDRGVRRLSSSCSPGSR